MTRDQIISAVKEHIIPELPEGVTVVFAGRDLLEKENAILEIKGLQPLLIENV